MERRRDKLGSNCSDSDDRRSPRRSPRSGNVVIAWINEGAVFTLYNFSSKHCIYFVYNCCYYHSDCCMDCIHSRFEIVVDLQMVDSLPVPSMPKTNAALKKVPILH